MIYSKPQLQSAESALEAIRGPKNSFNFDELGLLSNPPGYEIDE
jgi:hypothetical protein